MLKRQKHLLLSLLVFAKKERSAALGGQGDLGVPRHCTALRYLQENGAQALTDNILEQ